MAEGTIQQTSFNAGLLSEFLGSRTDAAKVYERGCSVLDNFLPTVEGPLTRVPGTRFLAPQADEDYPARLIPFRFSTEQAYQLEFGEGVLRVFRDQALILDSAHTPVVVDTITPANPLEILLNSTTGLTTGDTLFFSGVDTPQIDGQFFRITVVSGFNITLDGVDGTTFDAQVAPAGTAQRVYSLASPYTSAQAQLIQYVQAGDVLYLACDGVARHKLSRLDDDQWVFAAIDEAIENTADDGLGSWPPFGKLNDTEARLVVDIDGAPGATVEITSDQPGTFTAQDVGRYIMLQGAVAEMGYGLVTAFTDDQTIDVEVYSRFPNGTAPFTADVVTAGGGQRPTKDWAWSAFDDVNGHPRSVTLFDSRLWWSGSSADPTLIVASIADGLENHRRYDADPTNVNRFAISLTNAFVLTPKSGTLDGTEWLAGLDVLFFGTLGGEWVLRSSNPEQAVGPNNILVRQQGRTGSRRGVVPLAVDSVLLFVQRAGRKLKEFVFNDTTQSYQSPDMTRLSRDVALGRFKSFAFQQEPNRVVWAVLEDGGLRAFTYERQEEVSAWSTVSLGGTNVVVESVSVTPSITDDEDEVWLTVRRTINGVTRRYVEVMQPFWSQGDEPTEAFFVHSGLSTGATAAGELHGLLHLIGETVDVLIDGADGGQRVVTDRGSIELTAAVASDIIIGLPYRARYRSMRAEFGGSAFKAATASGHRKRVARAALRLIETGPGVFIGQSFDEMDEVPLRDPGHPMDAPVPLFTGDTGYYAVPGGFDLDGFFYVEHRGPFPCTLAATATRMTSEEVP